MSMIAKIVLVLLYPLLLLARLVNVVTRRDRLRLRRPQTKSFWLEREDESQSASYFSESSARTARESGGLAGVAKWLLKRVARYYLPRRAAPAEKYAAAADREQGIPDEVYTLW